MYYNRKHSVNKVVPKSEVITTALAWAREIAGNSPDSVQATKRALVLSNQLGDVEDVVKTHFRSKEMLRVYAGDNIKVSPTSSLIMHKQLTHG